MRSDELPDLPDQIVARKANAEDLQEIEQYVGEYCGYFGADKKEIMSKEFFVLTANSANPYKQLYTSV